jgi:hypothetical protein
LYSSTKHGYVRQRADTYPIRTGYSTKTYPLRIRKKNQIIRILGAICTGMLKAQNWIRIGPWSGQRPSPIHSPVTFIPPLLLPSGLRDLATKCQHEHTQEAPAPAVRNQKRRPAVNQQPKKVSSSTTLHAIPFLFLIPIPQPFSVLSSHHLVLSTLSRCRVVLWLHLFLLVLELPPT